MLVEGDDHDEPVADAVRGILDGHVVLDRRIGEAGRYPAVDVLRSLSRTVPGCLAPEENALMLRARAHPGAACRHGGPGAARRLSCRQRSRGGRGDPLAPRIEAMLRQARDEHTSIEDSFAQLRAALDPP